MSFNTGSKAPSVNWKFSGPPVLDVAAATAKIRKGQASYNFEPGQLGDVTRVDVVQVPSNPICEDYMVSTEIDVGGPKKWHAWAIYDGHLGHLNAKLLAHSLIPYIERAIRAHVAASGSDEDLHKVIANAFTTLDDEIMTDGGAAITDAKTLAELQARLAPAMAGSCALVVLYDPSSSSLHVANVGDSRAVLGRRTSPEAKEWTTIDLSAEHVPGNPVEKEKVQARHPDQTDLFTKVGDDCERYVGIAITRAFGNARQKFSKELIELGGKEYNCRPPPPKNATKPPYLHATPDIQSTKVEKGDFLIISSDGLFDHLTSDDAITCAGKWVDVVKNGSLGGPEESKDHESVTMGKAQVISIWENGTVGPEYFVFEDDNVATHLVKNSLGGSQRQIFTGVMTIEPPLCRMVRDDLSVQVVFFGDM